MAVIEKRRKNNLTTYRARVRVKGFPEASATFTLLRDARTWAETIEKEIKAGKYFSDQNTREEHLLSEAIDRYVQTVLVNKPKMVMWQARQFEHWRRELGEYYIHKITAPILVGARDRLAHGKTWKGTRRTPATVNRYMAALSHLFTIAFKEWGWIEKNPFLKISKLKEPRGRVRYLSDDERVKLLAACQTSASKYLYPITLLCLLTGARKMEINGISWGNVDLKHNKIILFETKNDEIRSISLSPEAVKIFKGLLPEKKPFPSDLVFPSELDKTKPIEIRKAWDNALIAAEITDFRFHDLRHSAASYLAMNGATTADIAEILGHKTLSMVKRYAHLSESHTAKVLAAMNKKILSTPSVPKKKTDKKASVKTKKIKSA